MYVCCKNHDYQIKSDTSMLTILYNINLSTHNKTHTLHLQQLFVYNSSALENKNLKPITLPVYKIY